MQRAIGPIARALATIEWAGPALSASQAAATVGWPEAER